MIIAAIRTDTNRAYIGLNDDYTPLKHHAWDAHRELVATLYTQLKQLLDEQSLTLNSLNGLICYEGPGSFTGLRIGLSAANALAYSLNIPIVSVGGEDWIAKGIDKLLSGENQKLAIPFYGAEAHITAQKK